MNFSHKISLEDGQSLQKHVNKYSLVCTVGGTYFR